MIEDETRAAPGVAPDVKRPIVLEYGRPAPPITFRQVAAGFCGVIAALFAVPVAFVGGQAAVAAMSKTEPKVDRPNDAFAAAILICVALISAAAGWRWISYAIHAAAVAASIKLGLSPRAWVLRGHRKMYDRAQSRALFTREWSQERETCGCQTIPSVVFAGWFFA